jgi:hypothetical protein
VCVLILVLFACCLGWMEAGILRFNELHTIVTSKRDLASEKAKDKQWMERMALKMEMEKMGRRNRRGREDVAVVSNSVYNNAICMDLKLSDNDDRFKDLLSETEDSTEDEEEEGRASDVRDQVGI